MGEGPSIMEGARPFTETPTGMKVMGVVTHYKLYNLQRVSFKATYIYIWKRLIIVGAVVSLGF